MIKLAWLDSWCHGEKWVLIPTNSSLFTEKPVQIPLQILVSPISKKPMSSVHLFCVRLHTGVPPQPSPQPKQ